MCRYISARVAIVACTFLIPRRIFVFAAGRGHADTLLLCTLPAGEGQAQTVSVLVGSSATYGTLTYDAPSLAASNALSVTSSSTVGGGTLAVAGMNFGQSGVVTIGGTLCTTLTVRSAVCFVRSGVHRQHNALRASGALCPKKIPDNFVPSGFVLQFVCLFLVFSLNRLTVSARACLSPAPSPPGKERV